MYLHRKKGRYYFNSKVVQTAQNLDWNDIRVSSQRPSTGSSRLFRAIMMNEMKNKEQNLNS